VALAGDENILICPGVGGPFKNGKTWTYESYGHVLGYNYLGGHKDLPWERNDQVTANWQSPQKTSDNPMFPLVTELNAWTTGEKRTWAPHGKWGPIREFADQGTGGITSKEAGAAGGNIGFLDGSATWKPIEQMDIYQGSRNRPSDGCLSYW
jgi:prepilin-type processing-associated H-X9-DG protein